MSTRKCSGPSKNKAASSHLWFSLLSYLRNHCRNLVETLHMISSQCLDISTRKRFRSINKYGRTAAIFKITNCPLLNTVTISLSHLLRDHWLDSFETYWRCFPSGLVVSAGKLYRPVDKYGRQQPSLIFTISASPRKPLEEFSRNLANEFLSMSRCVRSKMILVHQQI